MIVLFEKYPLLGKTLPYVSLGDFPTPVVKLERLGTDIGVANLFVKRDDVSGEVYGGNKVRKLEFLLGKALRGGRREVMTFGAAGSNHALATAVYSKKVGLDCISILMPQPNARYVRKNLLMSARFGSELHHCDGPRSMRIRAIVTIVKHMITRGCSPMVIPFGGTNVTGTIGYVNAGFELAEQIGEALLPEPDIIYIPFGSMGTAVGLALGLKAAGLGTRLEAVHVVPPTLSTIGKARDLARRTVHYLHAADSSFPLIEAEDLNINVRNEFFGGTYARFTDEGMDAVSRAHDSEGLLLDGTYTGNTFAALLRDADAGLLRDKTVLFWNTLNSRDLTPYIHDADYHDLPEPFHRYFEKDVQPLDR